MPALTANDVTYTERPGAKMKTGGTRTRTKNRVRVQFGNGVLTYPTGGVPLTLGKLGLTTELLSCEVHVNTVASANPAWKWNGSTTSPKLLGFEINAAGTGDEQFIELDATDAPVAQDLELVVEGF